MSGHAGASGESEVCVLKGSKLSLESKSSGVAASSVVENYRLARSGLCKSG